MSGTADRLLKLMYEWMDEAGECSSNLRGLAQELESLREKCNAVETVSSTTAVAGTVLSILAAPFTGGASLVVGAVAGGLGAGVSVITNLIETFESSGKLDRVKEIDTSCSGIVFQMQLLYGALREECQSSSDDEKDEYVVKEFLKAMLRQMRLTVDLDMNDPNRFVKGVLDNLNMTVRGMYFLLVSKVIGVLSAFSLKLGGSMLHAVVAAGGVQIGKAVIGAGAKTWLLGLAGTGFSLYESIRNWKELIENKHGTQASKSLRKTAKKIDHAKTDLSDKLSGIKKMLKESWEREVAAACAAAAARAAARYHHLNTSTSADSASTGDPPRKKTKKSSTGLCQTGIICLILLLLYALHSFASSEEEEEEEEKEKGELKMAVLNARSINKLIKSTSLVNRTKLMSLILSNSLKVLLVTETWLKQDTNEDAVRSILPPGFSYISEPRRCQSPRCQLLQRCRCKGGGVMIVHSDELRCRKVHFDTISSSAFEFVVAECTGLKVTFLFVSIYRPTKKSKTTFLEELPTLLKLVYSRTKYAIVGGDFNIWVDRKNNSVTRKFENILNGHGLVQHVSEITRKPDRPEREGHTLDLLVTRLDVIVSALSVRPNSISDHKTVFATVEYDETYGVWQLFTQLHELFLSVQNALAFILALVSYLV